jgi:selenide,water dikinase
MLGPLLAGERDPRVLVGPETGDDAGVFLHGRDGLVATTDFITPVCDEPRRFGRVAAANSLSDVYAMGGRPLFALNICCFPKDLPEGVASGILAGAADALAEAGAALLGGHSVADPDLKYGLAAVGVVDPDRVMTHDGARPGDRLLLTKPLGTGVIINGYRAGKLDRDDLEPALVEMERLNAEASRLAAAAGVRGATDVTGFGLAGHALKVARRSGVRLRLRFDALEIHPAFFKGVAAGVTTGSTRPNRRFAAEAVEDRAGLDAPRLELLFDPQTSGGLLLFAPPAQAPGLLAALLASGHRAREIGEAIAGPPGLEIV